MFDIGFWELMLIAVVLLVVMGPERLPEVARQVAFYIRKLRQGMFRLRSEMRAELDDTAFDDLRHARQEMTALKRDIRQAGSDLVNQVEDASRIDEASREEEEKRRMDRKAKQPARELDNDG